METSTPQENLKWEISTSQKAHIFKFFLQALRNTISAFLEGSAIQAKPSGSVVLAYSLLVQAYIGLFVFLILVVKCELVKGYRISGTVDILDSERNFIRGDESQFMLPNARTEI